jgi:hypothetical protein
MLSNVWLAMPSARSVEQVEPILDTWRERGYKIALWRDSQQNANPHADCLMFPNEAGYPGYAQASNLLVDFIIRHDPAANWIVCAGDDTLPDLNFTAQEIAQQCGEHFYSLQDGHSTGLTRATFTFGVMQPTGDRWGDNQPPLKGAYIDRICGSSWFGREFAKRIYGGKGLWWPEYFHMYADEEMFNIATKLGVLWQRPDLIHYHKHWGRKAGATKQDCPAFLQRANSPEHWREAKALFERRRAAGFPGHEPL